MTQSLLRPVSDVAPSTAAPSARSSSGALLLDRVLTESCLESEQLLPAIRTAFIAISRGEVSAPPRIAAASPHGLLGAMTGYVPGLGMAAKLTSVFTASPGAIGTHSGIVGLFDEQYGHLVALLHADAITAARTAGSATVAMQTLAAGLPRKIAVIGSGVQARAQVQLLAEVAPDSEVVIGARNQIRAAALASLHNHASASNIEHAVRWADMVFCCTDSREPVIRHDWLTDRMWISSVGGSNGPELDHKTIADGNVFVEWAGAVSARPPAGAHELQGLDESSFTLIGSLLDGQVELPKSAAPMIFKSTGHAALDVAAASVAYAAAREQGAGVLVDL